jgi:hypothetical protein
MAGAQCPCAACPAGVRRNRPQAFGRARGESGRKARRALIFRGSQARLPVSGGDSREQDLAVHSEASYTDEGEFLFLFLGSERSGPRSTIWVARTADGGAVACDRVQRRSHGGRDFARAVVRRRVVAHDTLNRGRDASSNHRLRPATATCGERRTRRLAQHGSPSLRCERRPGGRRRPSLGTRAGQADARHARSRGRRATSRRRG